MNTHKIEIACDTRNAERYRDWLIAQGHAATIGGTTSNYIDGVNSSADETANDLCRELWEQFCDS
jgi:hypothetical protein